MQEKYDISIRCGSFLDTDTKLFEKYLNKKNDNCYDSLVALNVQMKSDVTRLKRYFSRRQECFDDALFFESITK